MDRNTTEQRQEAFVVHETELIAEDLREILEGEGITSVRIASRMADVSTRSARLVVIDGTLAGTDGGAQLRGWVEHGLAVLVLDGQRDLTRGLSNVVRIDVPFRTQDVSDALRRILRD